MLHARNSFLCLLWEALQYISHPMHSTTDVSFSGSTLKFISQPNHTAYVNSHQNCICSTLLLSLGISGNLCRFGTLLGPSITSPMKVVTCCKKISISPPPKMFNFRLDVQIPDRFPNIGGWEKEEEGFTILFLFMGVQANFVTRFNQVDPFGEKCQTSLSSWLPWANGIAF